MQTSYALSQSVIPVENQATLDLLLRFQSNATGAANTRRPLNLSLVIDRSGSMAGEPLKQALRAAEALVEQLLPEDILSIVTYDDHIDTILPPQPVTDKPAIRGVLHSVRAGGTTNLSGGWLKGCEHVQAHLRPEAISRVLLLTDGQANVGVTAPNILIKTARQKAEAGVITTTLGFGAAFNEDLLIGMAQAAGGNFYFIQTPDDAADVFRIELDSLKSVVAQNLSVTVQTESGVTVTNVLSGYRVETTPAGLVIALGDVYANEEKNLALELSLPAQNAVGSLPALRVAYTCDAITEDGIQTQAGEIPIYAKIGTVEEAISAVPGTEIIHRISKIRLAKAKDDAVALADKGDHAAAVQILRATVADLRQKGLHESFEIAEELDQLEHYAEQIEKRRFDNISRKEMRDQSYQGGARNRADLSLRGVATGSARDLETISPADAVGQGVQVQCSREGGKLRIKVLSDGYNPMLNVQFPRSIREEGITYLVEALQLSADGTFYRTVGKIRRIVLPGQENRYARSGASTAPKSNRKAATGPASAADLETTTSIGDGVLVQCVKEGSKLRARVVSDGFDPDYNMRFPRDIREEGILYVVDEVIEPAGGGSYIACGKIRRLIQ